MNRSSTDSYSCAQDSRRAFTTPASTVRKTPNSVKSSALHTSFLSEAVNAGCFVALVEGRGSARGEIGMACISLHNPSLILCQFSDTRTYIRTLTKLAYFNPAEILIPYLSQIACLVNMASADGSKLYDDIVANFVQATVTQVHRKYFNDTLGHQTVKQLCASEYSSVELQLNHKSYALAAANALLKYMEHVQNIIYAPRTIKVEFQAAADSVLIDLETAKHVELLCSLQNPSKSRYSLFGFLNHCRTASGVKYLRSCIFQPAVNLRLIQARLNSISELLAKPEMFSAIHAVLARFIDIDQLLSLCVNDPRQDTLSAIDQKINHVIGLKHVLELVPSLHTALSGAESSLLLEAKNVLENPVYSEMLAKILGVIHDEARAMKESAGMKLQRCFAIKGGLNGLLDVARRTYCEIVDDIENVVKYLSDQHGVPMKVGFNSQRGYHIQTPAKAGLRLSDLPEQFLRPQKCRNAILFSTEDIIKLDHRSQDALREISLMSNIIVTELLNEIRHTIGSLYKLSEVVCTLDMLLSLAEVSGLPDFVQPEFGRSLKIIQGRHPIIEHMSKFYGATSAVPNDTLLTEEYKFSVISGANMSGKSTYLKQVVLLQIMAQIGCYLPAKSAQVRLCDCIFTRMGTDDSIECNASTFMLEMKEMAYILTNLTPSSLVVIDELCRATSTTEGSAICWAISEHIINSPGVFALLATHFSLMNQLAEVHSRVSTFSFLEEPLNQRKVQTHKLVRGQPENGKDNYGIDFALTTALPEVVVNRAAEIVSSMDVRLVRLEQKAEDISLVNCFRLIYRLKALKSRLPLCPELLQQFKALQEQFIDNE